MFEIAALLDQIKKPSLYQPGAPLWTHPHIAKQMLREHLSPNTDAASYRPSTIEAICDRLPVRMGLEKGMRIIDLGCGPGLYCQQFAQRGYRMTGIDQSESSIQYAKELCASMPVEFLCDSYLNPLPVREMNSAIMISQDYGVLSPGQRKVLLQNVRSVLKPGGMFAFDVASIAAFYTVRETAQQTWDASEKGFWRPHPYLVLENTFLYSEQPCSCNLYAVIDEECTVYRIWQTYFSPESIQKELQENGFTLLEAKANLSGDDWTDQSLTIGIICKSAYKNHPIAYDVKNLNVPA